MECKQNKILNQGLVDGLIINSNTYKAHGALL